ETSGHRFSPLHTTIYALYALCALSGTSKFRRNLLRLARIIRPKWRMPAAPRAPLCGRPVIVASCLVPQGKLDTVPHSQLVVDGSQTVLDDVLRTSNCSGNVPLLVHPGDERNDGVFTLSWASFHVKITSGQCMLLLTRVAV